MIRSIRSIVLILSLLAGKSFSQVAKDDFEKISKAYAASPHLSMKMKYEVYKNKTTTVVLSTETGILKRKDKIQYSRIGKIETVENDRYHMIVDHEDKNISLLGIRVVEGNRNQQKEETAISLFEMEKMLALCSKVEFKKWNAVQNAYTLVLPDNEYDEVQVIFNARTFFIEKLILFYAEKQNLEEIKNGLKESPRMEISYSDIDTNPDFENTPFSYDAFLEKQNGKLVAKAAYKDYEIHDQLFN